MNKIFSDRNLLISGIVLLLINIGYVGFNNGMFANSNPTQVTSSTPKVDATLNDQVFRSGLITPLLHWDHHVTVTDENGQKKPFDQLLSDQNKLILRFSELSCNTCVDREVAFMKQFADLYGHDKVVVLTTYNNQRDLIAFKRMNQLKFEVYHVAPEVFSPEQAGGVFLFLANKKSGAFMPFLPDKEDESLSVAYYRFIGSLMKV